LHSDIEIVCFVGAFSNTNSLSNCWLMRIFLCVSLFLFYGGFPASPLILEFIFGPMLEADLRKGLTYADSGILSFFSRPVSCVLLFAVGSLFMPLIRQMLEKWTTVKA